MAPQSDEAIDERFRGVWRRLDVLEATKPEAMRVEVRNLSEDVRALKRAFYTFSITTVGAAVLFAFSVFSLLGRHP